MRYSDFGNGQPDATRGGVGPNSWRSNSELDTTLFSYTKKRTVGGSTANLKRVKVIYRLFSSVLSRVEGVYAALYSVHNPIVTILSVWLGSSRSKSAQMNYCYSATRRVFLFGTAANSQILFGDFHGRWPKQGALFATRKWASVLSARSRLSHYVASGNSSKRSVGRTYEMRPSRSRLI